MLLGVPMVVAAITLAPTRGGDERSGGLAVASSVVDTTASTTTSTTATSTTSTTVASVPFPSGTQPLAAGRYLAAQFSSPFEFELPAGWRATAASAENQLELVRTDGAPTSSLTFLPVTQIFDPHLAPATRAEADRALRPAPTDLVQWLRAHPRLAVGDAAPVTKGALSGTAVPAQVSVGYAHPGCEAARPGRRCVLMFTNDDDVLFALSEGYRAVFYVLRLGTTTLVAAVESPVADFDRFALEAERVLSTLARRPDRSSVAQVPLRYLSHRKTETRWIGAAPAPVEGAGSTHRAATGRHRKEGNS